MGTCNFAYQNRCIVVRDEDYEGGNIPALGDYSKNSSRNYPSTFLADADFKYHDVFITSGYYSDACIDYDVNDIDVEYYLGGTQYYDTQTAFFNECKTEFGLSEYRLRKVCGNVGEMDIEEYLEQAYEKLTDYLRECEESEVNKYLDNLKDYYGYDELKRIGIMSNGEGVYRKIS